MASTICGWCGDRTHMTLVHGPALVPSPGYVANRRYTYTAAFTCANENCERISVAWRFQSTAYTNPKVEFLRDELFWHPAKVSRPEYPGVPDQIAGTASEAHACLSIQAYRGAVALARAVVEATAKEKGITGGPLVQKIDKLCEQGHIREFTRQLAHEIREGGNEIAHGDLGDEPMPPEDAEAIVSLMDEILQEVYQAPAKMMALRQSRLDREQRNAEATAAP
ncbi:DUF4145 domain-containing protein [Streptomyces sp. NPDC088733]|uniref:DUF4145 domain-containing protein n=1 Tax=Streptomyces sp. NPDC088733 TaxID=3365880 RepID=UPI00380907B4